VRPRFEIVCGPQEIAPLLALATKALRAGRPADAIAPLRDAALLEPSNATIQHDLGFACLEMGRLPDAGAALQRAIPRSPRYADAYFHLGIALEKLGDMGGAIVAYDRATTLLPSLTEAWLRAGALVYTMGHREEAIGCFRRAAETGGKTRAAGRFATSSPVLQGDTGGRLRKKGLDDLRGPSLIQMKPVTWETSMNRISERTNS
jgi:tetratricopeptide (TPR) repeat protein